MRLKPEKVGQLSHKIFDVIKKDPECQFVRDEQMVLDTIRHTFLNDLKREDEVDKEIWAKLDAHAEQISNRNVSRGDLFNSAKRMIAKERGLVF
ncbi:DUF507 family protein [Candidatus Sumerlaeota bacterium]|nr:DUF507 family protein [Candidatus Sumerlaeota bacterium]